MHELLVALNYPAWALPALLLVPVVGAILIRLLGRTALPDRPPGFARWREVRVLTLGTLVVEFILACGLWFLVQPGVGGWTAMVDVPWIPDWGARFTVAVDGISMVMVLLTTFLMPVALIASWNQVTKQVRSYYALLLVLTTGIIGVFVSLDLLLFYIMWELMLVPMYFMVGIWGGERRVRASIKYFLFTLFGSLLMLVAVLVLWIAGGSQSFGYEYLLANVDMSLRGQLWLFAAFFVAFAVKSPLFPFHTWLPDAQHEAPTTAAVALGIKVAPFAVLRFALPLFPAAAMHPTVRTLIISLAVVSILYGALVAMVQPDFKRLVSYASISHLGFVMLGIFALTVQSVQGAVVVMLASAVSAAALFLLLGILHEQRRTGMIGNFGGLARVVPVFAAFLVLAGLNSIGLPLTMGFIGEFLVLIGSYRTEPVAAIVGASGVVLAAVYFLWAVQRTLFNPLINPENASLRDLNRRELGAMSALAAVIIWFGILPGPVLRRMEPDAARIVELVESRSAPVGGALPAPLVPIEQPTP